MPIYRRSAESGKENQDAQEYLDKAAAQGKDVTAVVARLAANSARQQAVLAKVLEKVPEQAKAAIQRAMEVSKRGLTKAQEMQTKEKGKPDTTGKPQGKGTSNNITGTSNNITGKPSSIPNKPSDIPGKPEGTGKPSGVPGKPN